MKGSFDIPIQVQHELPISSASNFRSPSNPRSSSQHQLPQSVHTERSSGAEPLSGSGYSSQHTPMFHAGMSGSGGPVAGVHEHSSPVVRKSTECRMVHTRVLKHAEPRLVTELDYQPLQSRPALSHDGVGRSFEHRYGSNELAGPKQDELSGLHGPGNALSADTQLHVSHVREPHPVHEISSYPNSYNDFHIANNDNTNNNAKYTTYSRTTEVFREGKGDGGGRSQQMGLNANVDNNSFGALYNYPHDSSEEYLMRVKQKPISGYDLNQPISAPVTVDYSRREQQISRENRLPGTGGLAASFSPPNRNPSTDSSATHHQITSSSHRNTKSGSYDRFGGGDAPTYLQPEVDAFSTALDAMNRYASDPSTRGPTSRPAPSSTTHQVPINYGASSKYNESHASTTATAHPHVPRVPPPPTALNLSGVLDDTTNRFASTNQHQFSAKTSTNMGAGISHQSPRGQRGGNDEWVRSVERRPLVANDPINYEPPHATHEVIKNIYSGLEKHTQKYEVGQRLSDLNPAYHNSVNVTSLDRASRSDMDCDALLSTLPSSGSGQSKLSVSDDLMRSSNRLTIDTALSTETSRQQQSSYASPHARGLAPAPSDQPIRAPKLHGIEGTVDQLTINLWQNMKTGRGAAGDHNCAKCGEGIGGDRPGCTALNQTYHLDCFLCSVCGSKLAGGSFYSVEGKPYCEQDYLETLDKCNVCQKPVVDRILRASGKPYHPGCFTCVACKKSLDGVPFTVDSNNDIHCVPCFHEKYAPRCARCEKPIVPDEGKEESLRVVAMDKSFHVDCYTCEDCSLSLNSKVEGRGCYPMDDHILCKDCNAKRVQQLNAK